MRLHAALSILVGLVTVGSLAGCGLGRSNYLNEAVGKATQQQVRAELGAPDRSTLKDGGQTVWIYQACPPLWVCSAWYATFDEGGMLTAWELAPEES